MINIVRSINAEIPTLKSTDKVVNPARFPLKPFFSFTIIAMSRHEDIVKNNNVRIETKIVKHIIKNNKPCVLL